MTNKKQELLEKLFQAMEDKYSASVERDEASSELDRVLQLRYMYTDSEVMDYIAKRADAETNYLIAEYAADAAYNAYIAYLRKEREAAANA